MDIKNLRPFTKFCMTIGELPTSYKLSLTYEEQLLWLCNYLENTVIPAINNNADAVTELQELYKELKSYVDNYFTNLDVQEEINNKLDKMAEDGTLDKIINQNIFGELNDKIETTKNDVTNLINSQNPVDFYKGKNLVVFGDSFTDPNVPNACYGYWVNRVATSTGMTPFNFAKGGASLMRSYNSFRMQVNRALNEMTQSQKDNTAVIIMYLADTDILEDTDTDQYVTEYENLCHLLVQNFTKAKIIVAPFTWRCNKLTNHYYNKMNLYIWHMKRWSNFPVQFLDNARFWLLGYPSFYQNVDHPNEGGYMAIAEHFINAIYGGQDTAMYSFDITSSLNLDNQTNDKQCIVTYKDGFVTVEFYCVFSVELNNKYDWIANFPRCAIPSGDIIAPLLTADGDMVGTFTLTSAYNGRANLQIKHLDANKPVFLTPLTFRCSANYEFS